MFNNTKKKLLSPIIWGNLLAMVVLAGLILWGVWYGLGQYTRHGESIEVPAVKKLDVQTAIERITAAGLLVQVTDTGYVKTLPAECVLEQTPQAGEHVKSGRVIFLTINASKSPTIALPDIIDNCSLREAVAKLTAMGFKLAPPERVSGEKDWVYGISCKGRQLVAGDRISVNDMLTIQVGAGFDERYDSLDYLNSMGEVITGIGGDDSFTEITEE